LPARKATKIDPMTALAGTIAGLQPALQSLKVNVSETLKCRQSLLGGGRGSWLYGQLIAAQIAFRFFLLCGAVVPKCWVHRQRPGS